MRACIHLIKELTTSAIEILSKEIRISQNAGNGEEYIYNALVKMGVSNTCAEAIRVGWNPNLPKEERKNLVLEELQKELQAASPLLQKEINRVIKEIK